MPKTTKAPVKPTKKVTPKSVPVDNTLTVVYDKLEMLEYSILVERGPLTAEDMKVMMGWETEPQYKVRMVKEKGGQPEHWVFGESVMGDDGIARPVHCTNTRDEKVVCWKNANNRPFDEKWCEDLIHTVLSGQWAGPLTIPGETVNGETIRIGRYGRVLSGQHQGTALILADEWLQKSRGEATYNPLYPEYPFWNGHEHPVIETIVVRGLSEDERVLRTIDYVKPRTTADMLYTMELFRNKTPGERKILTKMLAVAIDTLWERTDTKGYKTHPEIVGFLERHNRLLDCVVHIATEDRSSTKGAEGRRITKLRLSAGVCSALCYLMGSAGPDTDGDVYRNEMPPSEKNLDWSYWDKAREFWARVGGDNIFTQVRIALNNLVDSAPDNESNVGLGGRIGEKLAIISKAWEVWKDHTISTPPFTNEDLEQDGTLYLSYTGVDAKGNKLPEGMVDLIDFADFMGIDCPESIGKSRAESKEAPMPKLSHDEISQAKIEADARRAEQASKLEADRAARRKGK